MPGAAGPAGMVTLDVAALCMVAGAWAATSGCPGRVGSNANPHVVDQALGAAMKSVTCTRQENWVIAPFAAALSLAAGTTSTAVVPEKYVRLASEDATTVPVAVCTSWNVTPRLPLSRSDTGAYSVTAPSPTTVGGFAVHDVGGDVLRLRGVSGGWLYVMDSVGAPALPGGANSFQPNTSPASFDACNRNVWVPRLAATAAATAPVTLKPTPCAGQDELCPYATFAEATRPPLFTPAQKFHVALDEFSVVAGAYTSTPRAEQE